MLGATIGGTFGLIIGSIGALSAKLRGRQFLHVVGKTVLQSAGVFGFFLSVGTGLRCDDQPARPLVDYSDLAWRRHVISERHITEQN